MTLQYTHYEAQQSGSCAGSSQCLGQHINNYAHHLNATVTNLTSVGVCGIPSAAVAGVLAAAVESQENKTITIWNTHQYVQWYCRELVFFT